MEEISKANNLSFLKITKLESAVPYPLDFLNHPRPHCCMAFVFDGCGDFDTKDGAVSVKKGDVIFIPEGSTYKAVWHGSPHVHYISLHFSFEFSDTIYNNKKTKIQKLSFEAPEELASLYKSIFAEYEKEKPEQYALLGLFYIILGRVDGKIIRKTSQAFDERIEKALKYIEEHYNESFSVSTLAKISNMSISHFHSCFKRQVGCSAIDYKQKICIHHAELLLISDGNIEIEEISKRTGFNSSIYFREIFKKITGKTPREYRKIATE